MPATGRNEQAANPTRKAPSANDVRPIERHATPPGPEEGHVGATEDQMSKTMPPMPDDDEPKQG
jgi:hypothetical protein